MKLVEHRKPRVLWIGDAVTQTGFERVTRNIVTPLHESGLEIGVLGINYSGDPVMPYKPLPYPVWPAASGGDPWGLGRVEQLCKGFQPDVVVINNDPWNVAQFLKLIPAAIPVVAYMPVDAPNQLAGPALNPLRRAIAYTSFGRKELLLGGYSGRCDVIPHGVNGELYAPVNKLEARRRLKFPKPMTDEQLVQLFIVGNVNRNQPRKRLDLTIQYFTQWWIELGQPEHVMLHLHCANRDEGWNVLQLAHYYGIEKNMVMTNTRMTPHLMMAEEELKFIYGMFDVQLSTTLGEGWGLTTHEGMACGIPQIVPEYSALGEWARDAVRYTQVTAWSVAPNGINTIGGVPDLRSTVEALHELYNDPAKREALSTAGFERAHDPRFNWSVIAEQFRRILLETMDERRRVPVGVEAGRS